MKTNTTLTATQMATIGYFLSLELHDVELRIYDFKKKGLTAASESFTPIREKLTIDLRFVMNIRKLMRGLKWLPEDVVAELLHIVARYDINIWEVDEDDSSTNGSE